MTELKNCPFCGGEAQHSNDGGVQAFSIFCTNCFAATPRHHHYTDEDTEENAAKAWNNRQPIEELNKIKLEDTRIIARVQNDLDGGIIVYLITEYPDGTHKYWQTVNGVDSNKEKPSG